MSGPVRNQACSLPRPLASPLVESRLLCASHSRKLPSAFAPRFARCSSLPSAKCPGLSASKLAPCPGRLAGPLVESRLLRASHSRKHLRHSHLASLAAHRLSPPNVRRGPQASLLPAPAAWRAFKRKKSFEPVRLLLQGRMILSAVPPCLYSVEILHFIGISLRKPISFFRCNGRMPDFST